MRWWMGRWIGADPCFFLSFWQGSLRENEITISQKNNRRCGGRTVITSTNTQNKLLAICEISMDSRRLGYLDLVGTWDSGWGDDFKALTGLQTLSVLDYRRLLALIGQSQIFKQSPIN